MNRMRSAENVANDVGAVQPRRHIFAAADSPVNKCHVLDGIERSDIGIALKSADLALYWKLANALDQLVPGLPIGDQIRNGNLPQLMAASEFCHAWPAHHRAIVVHQLRQHADRRQAGKPAQVDAGLGMSGSHQHTTVLGDQGKDVARAHEVLAPLLSLASARTVLLRSSAEMPLVRP